MAKLKTKTAYRAVALMLKEALVLLKHLGPVGEEHCTLCGGTGSAHGSDCRFSLVRRIEEQLKEAE